MVSGKEYMRESVAMIRGPIDQAPVAAPLAVCRLRLSCRLQADETENLQGQSQAEAGMNVDVDADCMQP